MTAFTMERFGAAQLLFLIAVAGISCSAQNTNRRPISNNEFIRDFDPDNVPVWKNPAMTQQQVAAAEITSTATPLALAADGGDYSRFSSAVPVAAPAFAGSIDERVSDLIAESVLRFALQLGQQLSETSSNSKSEVFSPTSLMTAFATLMLGAKGKSYHELKELFNFDYELRRNPGKFHEQFGYLLEDVQQTVGAGGAGRRKNAYWRSTTARNDIRIRPKQTVSGADRKPSADQVVHVANGLFSQYGYSLNPDYSDVIRSIYHAELESLDFRQHSADARSHINDWVARNTYGKIPNIINGDIASSTNIILASALYFRGFWEQTFFEAATQLDSFFPDGPTEPAVDVQMMATAGVFPFHNSIDHDCRIIGLPYKGNTTTMYVIQPNQSSRDRLRRMQKYLDANKIETLISRMTQKSAVIAFPKLHMVRDIKMKPLLSRLGVNDIFVNGLSDLSLIATGNSTSSRPAESSATTGRTRQPSQLHFSTFDLPTIQKPIVTADMDVLKFPRKSYSGLTSDQDDVVEASRLKRETNVPLYDRRAHQQHSLQRLEAQRLSDRDSDLKSDLFVDDIVHKVDFDLNEQGTEAAAATLTVLRRSGTDVLFRADTPFMILIRHDPTKLVLFYGLINEPEL